MTSKLTKLTVVAMLLLLLGVGVSGCGKSHRTQGGLFDERAGLFHGVGIGSPAPQVVRAYGPPPALRHPRDPAFDPGRGAPASVDPSSVGGPNAEDGPHGLTNATLRYPNVAFDVAYHGPHSYVYTPAVFARLLRGTVYAVTSTAPGTRTLKGVAIGDPLAKARRLYPTLHCSKRNGPSESIIGDATYPGCTGKIGRDRYLWFGRDPINLIQVSSYQMG